MPKPSLIRLEKVVDWPKRIAGYSDETKAKYAKMWEVEKEYEAYLSDKTLAWRTCYDSKKPGEELYYEQAVSKRGFQLLRIRGRTDSTALASWRAYLDRPTRLSYDRNISGGGIKKVWGTNLIEAFQTTNAILAVSSRDLHQMVWSNQLADGTIKLIAYDLPEEPAMKGRVRMRAPVAGLTLTPDPNDPSKCELR